MSEHAKPLPRVTPDSAAVLGRAAGAEARCCPSATSAAARICRRGRCARSASRTGSSGAPARGAGRISTWTVVHKAWFPAFAGDVPYNVVQVELDEGPRLTASVVGLPNDRLAVGLRGRRSTSTT